VLGRRPDRRGGRQRSQTKALVAVAAEVRDREMGRIRLQRIPDASGESLVGFVREAVEQGAIVRTDGWTAYPGLARAGYTHRPRAMRRVRQRPDLGRAFLRHSGLYQR
jgi:hypothetical protein